MTRAFLCDPARLRILFLVEDSVVGVQSRRCAGGTGEWVARELSGRPRQTPADPSGGERTGRRARDPDRATRSGAPAPWTGPAHRIHLRIRQRLRPFYSLLTNRNEIGRLFRMSFRKQT